ncbi:GroS Co-chaperonin GroES (HSP10) [uncultured Caudovirales phage]|jgi:chaperonin GroES|uniref:GroS Co-chaperonin GroES (HSP10) n=1 Tax=uncultured Caudovirales phage TaxID=2100421 RepID=A0A6J5L0L9_9CAUD|nr:GroS Co-chaperonin GroES (HSP10) [uncultured Caudovirales phage]
MTCPIIPLEDYVVVVVIPKEKRTASGIIIPDSNYNEVPCQFTVVAVGRDVDGIQEGDHIITERYAGQSVTINDIEYVIVEREKIKARIRGKSC